jgi:hypothetical protein
MEETGGTSALQPMVRLAALLGVLCLTTLVLMGCGAGRETAQSVSVGSSALPHSMKGYELYSWQVGKAWHFTLITGTNRLKTYAEIVSTENTVTASDWVKLSVQGMENLRAVLNRLPPGETVIWISEAWLDRVGGARGEFRLPGPEQLQEIESHCRRVGLQLQVAD